MGLERDPGATRVRLTTGDSLSSKGHLLCPQLTISPASATTVLAPTPFPLIPLLKKMQKKLKGYWRSVFITSPCCRPPHMLPPWRWPRASTRQGWASNLAGARQHWKVLLVDHEDHALSPGAAPAMEKALLRREGGGQVQPGTEGPPASRCASAMLDSALY